MRGKDACGRRRRKKNKAVEGKRNQIKVSEGKRDLRGRET